ncbi:amino acid adenylation domain-containing protein [Nocardia nova]|uniref:amino acid adenylation domain-containing protein n=1 Tax=Nocardia nova TaxID=37330 RepID=UPI001C45431D|nr:amino acid adenylation domain-containing protein [Nocardia nova]MBV7706687.1 amino acid adenylation domain-containing protein [Nocardia nova]
MQADFLPGVIAIATDFRRAPVQRYLRAREEHRPRSSGPAVAALIALIHRYSEHAEVTLGVIAPEVDSPSPLRVAVEPDRTAQALAAEVDAARSRAAAARAGFDIDELIATLCPTPVFDRHPLFQIAYCEITGEHDPDAAEDALEAVVGCDLVFVEDRGAGELRCEYDAELFEPQTVRRLLAQWAMLIDAFIAQPDTALAALPMLPEEDRAALDEWSTGPQPARPATTLHALIAERAASRPGSPAVVSEAGTLSYGELDDRAARVAGYLSAAGVRPRQIVALCLRRSPRVPVLALGVMKAGAAYLPLDPADPDARLATILADSGASVVLCDDAEIAERLSAGGVTAIDLDAVGDELDRTEPAPARVGAPTDLAYVIYTSGSTGRPKGVLIEHAAICNRLLHDAIRIDESDRVLQKTPLTFDVSVWDLFYPLVHGAQSVLCDAEGHRDSRYLLDVIRAREITVAHFVPSMLRTWLAEPGAEACTSLRYVTTSGEALPADVAAEFHRLLPDTALYNYYGPTEAAVDVTGEQVLPGAAVTLGRPIENVRALVLDAAGQLVPAGVPGQLHLAGVCLARGYVDPADEIGRFVADRRTGERLYATGDRVRRLPDGRLEYLGRADHQLKLRGLRIEAGEVEAALRSAEGVREAVVTVFGDDPQRSELVGYVSAAAAGVDTDAVRAHARTLLPAYMVPAKIVVLEEFPRNTAGKIDRRSLPAPVVAVPGSTAASPSDLSDAIAAVWAQVLECDSVPATANFFDLGGNSLLVARVHLALEEALGISIARTDLFRYPTVAALAAALAGSVAARESVDDAGDHSGPFAVIGMAVRVPGAADLDEFWDVIADARTTMTELDDEQLRAAGESEERIAAPNYVRTAAVLDDIAGFDAEYFGFTAREAQVTDPQHRLLLECAVEALEHAGYGGAPQRPRTGVFVGGLPSSYFHRYFADDFTQLPSTQHYQIKVGNEPDFLPTSIAYRLDLHGPAVTVQSACSTSLVAVHLACQSIGRGECEIALAGGVAVRVPDRVGYLHQEGMVASPDGHCRAFDEQAGGTVFGNGAGVVVLKRLDAAVRDGDRIFAVVRGTAINNDGSAKVGFTAPSVDGQVEVIRRAHRVAGVAPAEIGYVEAHGTATPMGDPMEIAALTEAFGGPRADRCEVGSVKANIGHLDTAAGVAGFVKAVLALDHAVLPGLADLHQPSSRIPWSETPFRVSPRSRAWPSDRPRIATVSAFGIGGTNAHAVLEAAPPRIASAAPAGWTGLFRLSARSEAALRDLAQRYLDRLDADADVAVEDVCYTTGFGREHHGQRLAAVISTLPELRAALAAYLRGEPAAALFTEAEQHADHRLCLVLGDAPEAGVDEFLDRYADDAVVRKARAEVSAALGGAEPTGVQAELARQYVLVQMWRACGLHWDAVIGYGAGEYVAATISGVLDLATAMRAAAAGAPAWAGGERRDLRLASHAPNADAPLDSCVAAVGCDRMLVLGRRSDERARLRLAADRYGVHTVPAADGPHDFSRGLLVAAAKLYASGVDICPTPWGPFAQGCRIPLPTYAFQRSTFWVEPKRASRRAESVAEETGLPGRPVDLPLSEEIRYERGFACDSPSYVTDHRLFGTAVVPGASHIAMVLAAAAHHIDGPYVLRDTLFLHPFAVSDGGSRRAQLVLRPSGPGWDVTLVAEEESGAGAAWPALFRTALESAPAESDSTFGETERGDILARCPQELSGLEFYRDVWVPGLDTGNSFHWIESIRRGDNEALCLTTRPEGVEIGPEPLHAGLVEAAFQVLNSCWKYDNDLLRAQENIYVPFSIDRYYFSGRRTEGPLWIHARLAGGHGAGDEAFTAHIRMYSATGELVVAVDGFESRRISRAQVERALAHKTADITHEQHWQRTEAADTGTEPVSLLVVDDEPDRLSRFALVLRARAIPAETVLIGADAPPGSGITRSAATDAEICAWPVEFAVADRRGYVDLRGLTRADGESARFVGEAARRCAAAVRPLPALASERVRVWWPTRGAQPVTGDADVTDPAATMLWGIATVVRREYPELRCSTVDLDGDDDSSLIRLAAEIHRWSPETRIAHRGGNRYVARLRRAQPGTDVRIRRDRSYLVTGGLRGIGPRVAHMLAEQGAGHLVLVGRTAPDPETARLLDEIRDGGCSVTVYTADIGAESLAGVVAAAPHPLGGIVHAAGVLDDATIAGLDAGRFEKVLAPKVGGIHRLREIIGADTEFVVCFSSLTATVGAGGQANYAAANAYLDGYASLLRAQGIRATSIAWGPWGDIGMAARLDAEERERARLRGYRPLSPEQGLRLLAGNLIAAGPTVVAADLDWPKLAAAAGGDPWYGSIAATPAAAGPAASLRERVLAAARSDRAGLVRELTATEVKAVLGLDAGHLIDPEEGFTQLGMDSLAVVELRSRLQDGFGLALPATFGFDHPTVEKAAEYLMAAIGSGEPDAPDPATAAVHARPHHATTQDGAPHLTDVPTEGSAPAGPSSDISAPAAPVSPDALPAADSPAPTAAVASPAGPPPAESQPAAPESAPSAPPAPPQSEDPIAAELALLEAALHSDAQW